MSWMDKNPNDLLQKAFFTGLIGIVLCLIPIISLLLPSIPREKVFFLKGFGILAQLTALSMVVLVLRVRKLDKTIKDKAKRMLIVLSVALLYFFLT
ncbi:hypothetical protein [Echinicola pacifica]|nr:hypothetical protein [Echinicola pacifica]